MATAWILKSASSSNRIQRPALLAGKIHHAFEQMLDVRIGDEKDARHARHHAAFVTDRTVKAQSRAAIAAASASAASG